MRILSKKDKYFSKGKHKVIDFDKIDKYKLEKLYLFFQEAEKQCASYLRKDRTEQAIQIYEKQLVPIMEAIEKKVNKIKEK